MMTFLKKLFAPKKKKLICGGETFCEVVDNHGRIVAKLYYERPNYDMKISYIYELQSVGSDKARLKELSIEKSMSKQCHDLVMNECCIPFAEKIFKRSQGYITQDKEPIETLEPKIQFEFIKSYYAHNLIDMVTIAFGVNESVKKNN